MRPFVHIGLIVTGRGEAKFLPAFFRALTPPTSNCSGCTFEVIARVGQLNEITSERRIVKMVRTGQTIPNRDQSIGHAARKFLSGHDSSFVILVDDLEHGRRERLDAIYRRYREALDTVQPGWRWRTSVHFFVNMLEAYYFADSRAVNGALGASIEDWPGDVETIRHPKNDLKNMFDGFDEVEHGEQMASQIDQLPLET